MRVGIAVFLACVSLLTASIASAQFPTVLSVKTNATFINDVQPSSDTNTFTVTRLDTNAGSQGSITFQKCTISGSPVTGATKVGNCKWNTFTDGDLSFLRFSFNFLIPDTTGNWGEFVLVNSNEFGRFARFWRPENEEAISTANGIVATESEDLPGDDWIINTTETSTHIFESNGTPILVNVQSAEMVTLNGVNFELVQATGIPNYVHTMTQEDVDTLNNRPNAATDFDNGETSAGVGQAVEFGEDIGYQPGSVGCGLGYWPRGPECPANVQHAVPFPVNPTPTSEECSTGLDTIGLALNGVSIFGWTDGMSYNNQGVWEFLAVKAERYDLDICGGHATQRGGYHHHGHSQCLAEQLGDEGSDHSPLYGYIADGYPIYGPYVATGTLAQSCWKTRDYDNAGSSTGCGQAGKRTCLLVDQLDITQGTTPAASPGPDTTQTITTQSGNPLVATSGLFFEDYYYDANCASQGIAFLDQHNGHTHDDLGYHYHITIQTNANNTFEDVFPSNVGPTFYGELQPNTVATCNTGMTPPP